MSTLSLTAFAHNTHIKVSGVLLLIWFVSFVNNPGLQFIAFPVISVVLTITLDLLFAKINGENLRLPFSSIVTGLLIGLILFPFEHVLSVFLAPLVAVFSKQFLRLGKHHLFNPAAFGMVVTSIFLDVSVSWWAVAGNGLLVLVIGLGAGYILWRLNRIWLSVAFLAAYGIYLGWLGRFDSLTSLIFDGTVFLFAFIILPEPVTSPARSWWRFVWGPLVVAIIAFYQQLGLSFTDPLLLSLLTANLGWRAWWVSRGSKRSNLNLSPSHPNIHR